MATVTKPSFIQITGGLQIDFTNTPLDRCRGPFPVSFTNNSSGPGTLSYLWNFGDGNTSTQQNPTNTYINTGNYAVTLAVTSSNGCTDTLRRANWISIQNITTAFTAPDSVCAMSPATFSNTSTPTPQSSVWNFGDGTNATAINPQKVFSTPGNYSVQVLNTYSYCTDSFSRPIRVLPKPAAAFTANTTTSCQPPLTVNFTNQSSGAVSYQWNFGDGNTSTQQNPTHTYMAYGNYTVTLIATNSSGCRDTLPQVAFIRIQRPTIQFPALPQQGCVPYTTNFSANISTLDNITSYQWNFGDGNTSSQVSPSHTYPTQGNYTISLTITTSTGCTETYSLPNAIVVGRVPVIDFTATPNPVCAFSQIQFNGIANEASSWLWNFGDGATANVQNPTHIYSDTGDFTVTLTVTNNGCAVTLPRTAFVKVNPPIADFQYQNDCADRKRFQFTDASIGGTSWLWDFGDGNTSTQQNPVHVYAAFGSYSVTLTAMNGACSHTKTYPVIVFNETPSYAANIREACKTADINFTTVSSNLANIVSYDWNFGNGLTSTAQNPQIRFTTSGTYSPVLVTTDRYGCRDTTSQSGYIRINGPTALFTVPVSAGCKGFTATFANQSYTDGIHPIAMYQWNFGDGASFTSASPAPPTHPYSNAGIYTPQLIVTDTLGCKDSLAYGGLIAATSPEAMFVSADTLTCLGSSVQFTNTSTPQSYTSQWDFGDGNTSTLQNPSHVYTDTGYYNVRLIITEQYGCPDTLLLNRFIRVEETIASFNVSDSLGGCTPFEVKFTNTSNFYNSSAWQLGNGSSNVENPSPVYTLAGTYPIQLVVTGRGGCTDSATTSIQIFDASATTFSYTPFTGCKPLPLTGTVNSPADLNFTWDFGDGTIITTTDSNIVYNYSVFGSYVPKLILSDSGNCLVPLIGTDTVRIIGATAKFGWDKRLFCDSGTVVFLDSTTFNDPIVSYTWNFGDGATSSQFAPTHSYASPGIYTVYLALQTQQNCADTFRVDQLVRVVESPSIAISGDTVICQNDLVRYAGLFNQPDTSVVRWNWQFPNGSNANQQIPSPQSISTAGSFITQAIAINSSGCADTATRNLLVNPNPVVTIPSPQITPLGTPVLLPASYINTIVSYDWTPVTGLTCTDCPQPIASPKFNTIYSVAVVDNNGCRDTQTVQVIVLCQNSNVFVPNTFSPNGDGSNDVFYVRGKGLDRVKSLRIFNRWGELVFERANFAVNDPTVGWNGTFKGKKLSPDVYVYQVDVFCDNSESIRFEGSISLIQ